MNQRDLAHALNRSPSTVNAYIKRGMPSEPAAAANWIEKNIAIKKRVPSDREKAKGLELALSTMESLIPCIRGAIGKGNLKDAAAGAFHLHQNAKSVARYLVAVSLSPEVVATLPE